MRTPADLSARQRFADVIALLQHKRTDLPVLCFLPHNVRTAAAQFKANFPGRVLFAVKANPDPEVLGWLVEAGIDAFDTASLAEMALAQAALPGAHLAYNHPIKPRPAIRRAYREFGVRDFVVDHAAELDKVFAEAGTDLTVQVRVVAPNATAKVTFNEKFGAAPEAATALLRAVHARGARAALTMHVGWQTTDPQAYARGLRLMADIAGAAAVRPEYLNVGGGFPSILMPAGRTLNDFFAAIRAAQAAGPLAQVPLRCEPGSALVTTGGAVLTQVLLVKEGALYLNDGIYGALCELIHSKFQPPTRVLSGQGEERRGALRSYRIFGPTCDSFDVSPVPFALPEDVREGDWLYLSSMGAYSAPLITDFNGLGAHEFVLLER